MKLTKLVNQNTKLISFFLICFISAIHIYAVISSDFNRTIIYEPDDNYHQIIKSSNLKNCFIAEIECKGNKSIHNNDKTNIYSEQISGLYTHTILVEYHLLKSIIINILNNLVLDYEKSQKIITLFVTLFLIFLGYLLINSKFGKIPSIIFLLINLPFVSIKYGFHFSHGADDLSTVFCLLAFYLSDKKISFSYLLIFFILFLFAVFSHPIGFFLIFLILLYEILFSKNIQKKLFYKFFIFFIVIILYFVLKFDYYNVEKNIFTLYNEFSFINFKSIFKIILLNFTNNLYFFYDLNNLINLFLLLYLILFYIKNLKKINLKYKSFFPFLMVIIFFISLSMFHPQPFTSLLTRMQVMLFIMISGICAVLIYEILQSSYENQKFTIINSRYIFVTFLVISYVFSLTYNTYNLRNLINSNQENLNLTLNDREIIKSLDYIKDHDIYFLNQNIDESVFNTIFYKFFYLGAYNKNFKIISNKINVDSSNNNISYLIKPSIMLNKRYEFKNKIECNLSNFIKCINIAWYNPERILNSDFLIKNNDSITFKKINKKIELSLFSKKNFIISSNAEFDEVEVKEYKKTYVFQPKENRDLIINFETLENNFIKLTKIKYLNSKNNLFPKDKFSFSHKNKDNIYEYNFTDSESISQKCNFTLFEQNISYEIYKIRC